MNNGLDELRTGTEFLVTARDGTAGGKRFSIKCHNPLRFLWRRINVRRGPFFFSSHGWLIKRSLHYRWYALWTSTIGILSLLLFFTIFGINKQYLVKSLTYILTSSSWQWWLKGSPFFSLYNNLSAREFGRKLAYTREKGFSRLIFQFSTRLGRVEKNPLTAFEHYCAQWCWAFSTLLSECRYCFLPAAIKDTAAAAVRYSSSERN